MSCRNFFCWPVFFEIMKTPLPAILIASAILSGGCTTSRETGSSASESRGAVSQAPGVGYDDRQIAMIERGSTTEGQLLQGFGPPDNRGLKSDGRINLAWSLAGGMLSVSLAPDGKVEAYSARQNASTARDFETGRPIAYDDRLVARIQRGETTQAQLVKWFGSPEFREMKSDGRAELAWNFAGRTDGGSSHSGELKVSLAPDGTVSSYSARRGPS
jgi:hypothetical protein